MVVPIGPAGWAGCWGVVPNVPRGVPPKPPVPKAPPPPPNDVPPNELLPNIVA